MKYCESTSTISIFNIVRNDIENEINNIFVKNFKTTDVS